MFANIEINQWYSFGGHYGANLHGVERLPDRKQGFSTPNRLECSFPTHGALSGDRRIKESWRLFLLSLCVCALWWRVEC